VLAFPQRSETPWEIMALSVWFLINIAAIVEGFKRRGTLGNEVDEVLEDSIFL
jgi:hypothetical protein